MTNDQQAGPHQGQAVIHTGAKLEDAHAAMILVHGRGASAQSILGLSQELYHESIAYLAPQAAGHTWYPYSFLAPVAQNEPGITSGLRAIGDLVNLILAGGIPLERIILGGFSQGACLTSEYAVRNPKRYGGLLIFSGGVIGPLGMPLSAEGSLAGTPVFIGCSEADAHIPVERVHETAEIFTQMGADVTKSIYPAEMGHTIIPDEIDQAMKIDDKLNG